MNFRSNNTLADISNPEIKKTFLVLCGVPGSGKSTLARSIEDYFSADYEVVHIEYDHIESEVRSLGDNAQENEDSQDCPSDKSKSTEENEWSAVDARIWKKARKVALAKAQTAVENAKTNAIIILDDNMYYASMRYEVLRLARRLETGYMQIYILAGTQEAIQLNEKRSEDRRVPGDLIKKMNVLMEPPRSNEAHSIVVSPFPDYHVRSATLNCEEKKLSVTNMTTLNVIKVVVESSLSNCLDNSREQEKIQKIRMGNESREKIKESVLHQVELEIKREVGKYISAQGQQDRRRAAAHAATVKKEFTKSLKEQIKSLLQNEEDNLCEMEEIKGIILSRFIPLLSEAN